VVTIQLPFFTLTTFRFAVERFNSPARTPEYSGGRRVGWEVWLGTNLFIEVPSSQDDIQYPKFPLKATEVPRLLLEPYLRGWVAERSFEQTVQPQ
jgi:hypothetical protein